MVCQGYFDIKLFKKTVTKAKWQSRSGERAEQQNHVELLLIFKAQVKKEL